MDIDHIAAIADQLWAAHCTGAPCPPVRDRIAEAALGGDLIQAAYAVQQYNHARQQTAGARLVGRKIGLTSLAVQKQLGVDSPDFGALFADMAAGDGEEIAIGRTLQPKAEAEIALVLGRDLTYARHTLADIVTAVAYALPAIEIVGSRVAGWDIRLADTVADNASSSLFVLGGSPKKLSQFDIGACAMQMSSAGATVSAGSGAACLGNPLNAALWLADLMVRLGTPLRAGDVLMTGALGPMAPVRPGDEFTAEIAGLGTVRTRFSTT